MKFAIEYSLRRGHGRLAIAASGNTVQEHLAHRAFGK